ncbi:DUF5682 family protein [Paenibacillus daejeonensis]|uniref:DUF5682 family protein n=1 Tax=Paenibacillus daejeonensis TaxID=135193 RepID=UPI000379E421|nr:DUF5682 family protein [Paenibacillus daejeonensis]
MDRLGVSALDGPSMLQTQPSELPGSTPGELPSFAEAAGDGLAERLASLCSERVYNLSEPVVYFPVRHHSPVCSHHLLRVMRAYRPEIVLIEGPEGASELIPVLADEATEPPVSLYCTYESDEEKAAWYYPLLSCSPEYTALKEAAARQIPCSFIDLDYRPRPGAMEEVSASLQDEKLLTSSDFMAELCRRMNCRSFEELWEKVFEIGGLSAQTDAFVRDVFTYCTLSRMCYSEQRLRREGELDREANMRLHIRQAREQYGRVLVVTGGFHTYGLLDPEPEGPWQAVRDSDIADAASPKEAPNEDDTPAPGTDPPMRKTDGGEDTVTPEAERSEQAESGKASPGEQTYSGKPSTSLPECSPGRIGKRQHYPMIYTFEEADRLNGYASGMPYVSYYDELWAELRRGRRSPYARVSQRLLARLTREMRKQNEPVSTSDAIEAYSMLQGLTALRGKREGGVYELMDAVLACFVKGEFTLATDAPLRRLRALLTGDKIGRVADSGWVVPIVEDVKRRAATARLELRATGKRKRTLDLYAKPRHRAVSQLLHCLSYLVPDFAKRESGPDWVSGRHMNLVRETWSYAYSARVEARLIEQSLYGGTLHEAAVRKLEETAAELPDHHSGELAELLLQALLMGLQETADQLYALVKAALRKDAHFLSLCRTLHALDRLHQHGRLLGLRPDEALPALLDEAYGRAVDQLPAIARAAPELHDEMIQGLKLLIMLAPARPEHGLEERFAALLDDRELAPRLEGVCLVLAIKQGWRLRRELVTRANGYIRGTPEQVAKIAIYLQGVFVAGRDVFLYDDELLSEVDALISELPHDSFVEMAADLRLAFTFFTPGEKALIAGRVARRFGVRESELDRPAVDERLLLRAEALDQAIRREFAAWNLT